MKRTPLTRKTPLKRTAFKAKPKTRKPSRPIEQKTKPELRKLADEWFSWCIRLRDSDFQIDGWYGKCISCSKSGLVAYIDEATAKKRPTGAVRFVQGWDAGHYVSRGQLVVRFNEENVNLQCKYHCNNMKSGNRPKYYPALQAKYGDEVPDKLDKLARDTQYYKFSREELLEIIHDSKAQVEFYLSQTT